MGDFQRNGAPENSTWKTNQDYFRGYTRATLEDIQKELKEMKDLHFACRTEMLKKTGKNKDKIQHMKLQSAMIGGTAGFFAGLSSFFRGFWP